MAILYLPVMGLTPYPHPMSRTRISTRSVFAILSALIATLTWVPAAQATTTNFNCGTSGTYQVDDATHTITGHTNCAGALTIDPSVTEIGANAFAYNESFTTIVIPSNVTTIGQFAFREAKFDSLTFSEGLTTLDSYAFYGSYNRLDQELLTLPNSLTSIGSAVFGQTYFRNFSIGGDIASMGSEVFYNNFGAGPYSVVFRGTPTFTSLQDTIFIGYKGEEIALPASITTIGTRIFEGAGYLKYLIIPDSVTSIAGNAFQSMSSLHTVILPNSLTTMGTTVFASTTTVDTVIYCGSASAVQNYSYPNGIHPVCAKAAIFMANGGSGTMRTETGTSTANLTANSFAKGGAVFAGWNTKADGSGTPYADGAPYSFASHLVLYAQWLNLSVPGDPTIGSAQHASATDASVTFTAPGSNGNSVIDAYECESTPSTTTVTLNQAGSGTCLFSGLTTGTSYQFNVRAHNAQGWSNYSALSNSVTPSVTAIDPTIQQREAERARQAEITSCKASLFATLKAGKAVDGATLTRCGYHALSDVSVEILNTKLMPLPVETRISEPVLSAEVIRLATYQDLQGDSARMVPVSTLVKTGILDASVPNKVLITLKLRSLGASQRDSIAEIDAFLAAESAKMIARKAALKAIVEKIASR